MTRIIDGSEFFPNPLRPDFAQDPTVEIGFDTLIRTSENGTETRIMRRRSPTIRTVYSATVIGKDKCQRILEWLSGTANSTAVAVPDFRAQSDALTASGRTFLKLPERHPGFSAGRHVQVDSGPFSQIARIVSVSPNGLNLNLDREVSDGFPSGVAEGGCVVRTVVPGSVSDATKVDMLNGSAMSLTLDLKSFPGMHDYPISAGAPVHFLGGGPTPQGVEVTRLFRNYDGIGRRIEIGGSDSYRPGRVIRVDHRAMGREDAEATRKFIDRCRGRMRRFGMPERAVQAMLVDTRTAANEFPAPGFSLTKVETYSRSGKRLHRFIFDATPGKVVEPVQVDDPGEDRRQEVDLTFGARTVRFRRYFEDPTNPVVYEAISVSDGSDPAAFVAPAAPPVNGSLISRWRLATDVVTLTYLKDDTFDVSFGCFELPDGRV